MTHDAARHSSATPPVGDDRDAGAQRRHVEDEVTDFEARRRVDQLPDRALIRRLRGDALPMPAEVWPRLEAAGLDPDRAGAPLSEIVRRGWITSLVALPGKPPRFSAYVLEPRFRAVWAMGRGATPAEALRAVSVPCLDGRFATIGPFRVFDRALRTGDAAAYWEPLIRQGRSERPACPTQRRANVATRADGKPSRCYSVRDGCRRPRCAGGTV
jgi:hypothetical protein